MTKQDITFNVDNTNKSFFADNISVLHNPNQFILDFKNNSPRLDQVQGEVKVTIKVDHNTVVVNPVMAKELIKVLTDSLEKYEKQFGEVKVPKKQSIDKKVEKIDVIDGIQGMGYIG